MRFSIDSLENIPEEWTPEVHLCCPHMPVILVGNKEDLRNDPHTQLYLAKMKENPWRPRKAVQCLAEKIIAYGYFECSAKTKDGVREKRQMHSMSRGQKSRSVSFSRVSNIFLPVPAAFPAILESSQRPDERILCRALGPHRSRWHPAGTSLEPDLDDKASISRLDEDLGAYRRRERASLVEQLSLHSERLDIPAAERKDQSRWHPGLHVAMIAAVCIASGFFLS
ncbi:hypothetical protein HPB48_015508 [Haemaphysalis longicornis]|uniref:Uncharacterized protein n=1 Tax=Haemaphysalis longicornis TaxID=44386 RepID=A0A9J6FHQ8_HAELO|nr:hypothetical protein HPB48_015508 [Haemaphysalis longicornis]